MKKVGFFYDLRIATSLGSVQQFTLFFYRLMVNVTLPLSLTRMPKLFRFPIGKHCKRLYPYIKNCLPKELSK